MTEAENTGVYEEAAAPEVEEMGNAQMPEETQEVASQESQVTDQEMNFRKLREAYEQSQREREEDRRVMLALQQELLKREAPQQTQEPEVDEFENLDPSDWMTLEQFKKLSAKSTANEIRKALEEYEAKKRQEELPKRIQEKCPDFDAVVTKDNVKQLQALEPDIAQALSLIGDEEKKAVAAYKYIKAFVPQAAETTAAKQRIQENANRPKSLSATGGKSPLSQAATFEQGLTPDLKKQLYAEMQAYAKQA